MNEIKQNSPYAWFLAARPKTLTGAIIPVLLGSALAFSDGQFKTAPALLCALFACGMQIAANFINDLFDFQKGTDRREDRLGPQRACAEGWITPAAMKTGIGIALTLSCLAGLAVLFTVWGQLPHGGWELVVLGVVCILFAFLYTTLLNNFRGCINNSSLVQYSVQLSKCSIKSGGHIRDSPCSAFNSVRRAVSRRQCIYY